MKRILLSLIVLMIALTCIASVSASSDFNKTVGGHAISANDGTVASVSSISGNNLKKPEMELPRGFEKKIEMSSNTSEDSEGDVVIEANNTTVNKTEMKKYNITIGEDNTTVTNPEKKEYEFTEGENNTTVKNQSNLARPIIESKLSLRRGKVVEIPDVDVLAPRMKSGDKIADAAVYYSAYYTAYKSAFSQNTGRNFLGLYQRPTESLIALVYQTHNEKDTIDIVTKVICMVDKNCDMSAQSSVHESVEVTFYEIMYDDPNYQPSIKKAIIVPGNGFNGSPFDDPNALQ